MYIYTYITYSIYMWMDDNVIPLHNIYNLCIYTGRKKENLELHSAYFKKLVYQWFPIRITVTIKNFPLT